MHLDDNESESLKTWVIKRLSDISDADSDVLADYVLALVKSDDPDAVVRDTCITNLQDFLQDSTESFVDEVIAVITKKQFNPSHVPATTGVAPNGNGSLKRSLQDDGEAESLPHYGDVAHRPSKQTRSGNARGGCFQQPPQQEWQSGNQLPAPPNAPTVDGNSPFAALLAMQQMMGLPPLPGMPPMPSPQPYHTSGHASAKSGRRCYDYDAKGYCAKGASCNFEHGEDAIILPPNEPYDPSNSTLAQFPATSDIQYRDAASSRGRGRGRGQSAYRGGNRRANISHAGQNYDRANTTIVVEQIPEDHFNESNVRDFFGQFGQIDEVSMRAYKRLATVKYDTYDAAKAAYDSPKVVFDNRFVKVYWHKMDEPTSKTNGHRPVQELDTEIMDAEPVPEVDLVAIEKKQAEAQRRHDENIKQRAAADQQRTELDTKLKSMEEEKRRLAAKLAKKAGRADGASNGDTEQYRTAELKKQLAQLEAEAREFGIDPSVPSEAWSPYNARGRGGYRGRGAPRGRGYQQGCRNRWAAPSTRGGAVKRLDNRPRTISITFPDDAFDQHDEALKQYLLLSNHRDFANLSRHPDRADAALLVFEERYRAENFMAAAASGIPHIGQVALAWQANPPAAKIESANGEVTSDEASKMDMSDPAGLPETAQAFDVADEDDRWV
ncbi:hypothetical protein B0A48_17526 [Cryoendolithus antarcticus]|uniref:C3H1-type domain-containing protein n=1 Tax=Cryoendolithus antarcticus TaxID=1507870 RepID=A0A1V8SC40_9PEZI|nr:hypothetical protein B0A48_17526 [Cryoendolithus antarcticus]